MTFRFALSNSLSFERHLKSVFEDDTSCPRPLRTAHDLSVCSKEGYVVLIHAPSFPDRLEEILVDLSRHAGVAVGVAADAPALEEMLSLSGHGIRAYFNSYMSDTHYKHMLRVLESGQVWFAPQLLAQALALARSTVAGRSTNEFLQKLTPREKEIALDIAHGLSNREIANVRSISERTVKTHLTRIFKKLHINDRLSLAVRLRNL